MTADGGARNGQGSEEEQPGSQEAQGRKKARHRHRIPILATAPATPG
jgi:hypothetical protein